MSDPSFFEFYQSKIENGEIKSDPVQEALAQKLSALPAHIQANKTSRSFWPFKRKFNKPLQGLYIHGGVGRGKSMLMDMFYNWTALERKKRMHFHEFMISVHEHLHAQRQKTNGQGVDNILPGFSKALAKDIKLFCFDEFHVSDIADAMILSRLLSSMIEAGIWIIATSNRAPEDLYEGGLQRQRFLPTIDFILEHFDIMHLDSPHDYRQEALLETQVYFHPLSPATTAALDNLFAKITNHAQPSFQRLSVKGRHIDIAQTAEGVARLRFADLCEKPLGASDYIALAKRFHTVFIEAIPKLRYDRRNEAKRFITLIDVLYEHKTRVIFGADAPPEKLYYGQDHGFEFDRTISRLIEMQGKDYLSADRTE